MSPPPVDSEEGAATPAGRPGKSAAAFRTISEVAEDLGVPQHVLRFWETKFNQVRPLKRGGRRRYYRPEDVALLRRIKDLLYVDGYTIKGVQRLLREVGSRAVIDGSALGPVAAAAVASRGEAVPAAPPPAADTGPSAAVALDSGQRAALSEVLAALEEVRDLLAHDP